jgi:hypothetical protein
MPLLGAPCGHFGVAFSNCAHVAARCRGRAFESSTLQFPGSRVVVLLPGTLRRSECPSLKSVPSRVAQVDLIFDQYGSTIAPGSIHWETTRRR